MHEEPIVEFADCSFRYDEKTVVDRFSLSVQAGEFLVLAGPNGAGKTTLLNLLSGHLRPSSGRVSVYGRPSADIRPQDMAACLGMVPQEAAFSFPYTVREVVRMGRTAYLGFWGFESPDDVAASREAMERCDLGDLSGRMIFQLSGGERQRAVIARALAQQPRILALDEPTRSLDLKHTRDIVGIIERIRKDSRLTVIMVTHDLNLAARCADRIVLVRAGGLLKAGCPAEVLTPEMIREAFDADTEVLTAGDGRPVVVPRATR